MSIRVFARAVIGAAALAASQTAPASAQDDAAALVRASGAALNVAALHAHRTLLVEGRTTIVGITGSGSERQDLRDGRYAQTAEAGPLSGGQGWDGSVVWNRDASGFVWDDGSAAARYGAIESAYMNAYRLWSANYGGASVAVGTPRADGGTTYDVLRVTPPGGLPFDLWLDPHTHLPVRTVVPIGITTTTTRFAAYRTAGGARIPFDVTTDTDGNVVAFHVTRVLFDEPGALAALRRPVSHVTDFALPGGITRIPFELVDNHVALAVRINGKGPYTFLFDTGGANLIDAGLAKELGLRNAGSLAGSGVGEATEQFQVTVVDALGIGDAVMRRQTFGVAPVRAGFGLSSGKPVDGLIGFEVLARFVTTFDYAKNEVVLRTSAPPNGGTSIPFVFNGQHVQIPCTISGFAGDCIVDTGSRIGLSVDSPFLAQHPAIVPANVTAIGANGFGVGGASLGRLGRTTLAIAGFSIPDVVTDLSTSARGAFADPFLAGNIGGAVWKRFALTLDYANRTLSLAPNAGFAARDFYDRSGLFLINGPRGVTVADVRPGTPAAQAGLARGDVLTTIDAQDARSMPLAAIRELLRGAPGTAVALGVAGKDGAQRTVTVTLRDYV